MTIHKPDGSEIGQAPGVWLDIANVRKMYERAKATGAIPVPHSKTTTPADPGVGLELDPFNNQWEYPNVSWTESKEYIVFVHGWKTSYDSARTFFAETMFKRLWQRGYKGRFAALYWPTLVGLNSYNESEYRAWFFGESLKQYIETLPGDFTKNLVAHSMGNIVAGSALRKGASITNYALIDAAVPASCYDPDPNLQQSFGNSPDNDIDPPTKALAYKDKLSSVSGRLFNFYLTSDDALEKWVLNNSLFKPELIYESPQGYHGYFYSPGSASGNKLRLEFVSSPGRPLSQMEESLAYASKSSTFAIGAEGSASGSIAKNIDLSTSFEYENTHSGPWEFPIQKIMPFYDRLMDELDIQRIQE